MTEEKFSKIRLLLNDPLGDNLCLKDIIDQAIKLNVPLSKLEYENSRAAIDEAKRLSKNLRRMAIDFEKRLKDDIFKEIIRDKLKQNNNN
jgi:hypothetical protein